MLQLNVYSLDIWGNRKDGYEVNDTYHVGSINVPSDSNRAILAELREHGWLTLASKGKVLVEWTNDECYHVLQASTRKPLFELR